MFVWTPVASFFRDANSPGFILGDIHRPICSLDLSVQAVHLCASGGKSSGNDKTMGSASRKGGGRVCVEDYEKR